MIVVKFKINVLQKVITEFQTGKLYSALFFYSQIGLDFKNYFIELSCFALFRCDSLKIGDAQSCDLLCIQLL